MEQRSQWEFNMAEHGWVWMLRRPDGTVTTSEAAWPTLKACVDDANAHGYVAWKAEEERRREQQLRVSPVLNQATKPEI